MKRKAVVIVALVITALGAGALVIFGSPQGPSEAEVAHLKAPRIVTLPPMKVLVVTAKGDPKTEAAKAFGLLMRTYFKLDGAPRGGPDFKAPRARWPLDFTTNPAEWIGYYALPVPDRVTTMPAVTPPEGLTIELGQWDYGQVAEVLHVGPWADEKPTIDALKAFIDAQGYDIAGDHEEEYLKGPGLVFAGDPATYLTVVRYAVRKRAPAAVPEVEDVDGGNDADDAPDAG